MSEVLSCLLLPLTGKNIILPSAAVAEICPYKKPKPIPDVPNWLVGILTWRGVQVPLVYLESMKSHLAWNSSQTIQEDEEDMHLHMAIINRAYRSQEKAKENINATSYPFFSIVLRGVPKLYRVTKDNVQQIAEKKQDDPRFMMEIKIQNEDAYIPNLSHLWGVIDAMPSRLQWFRQIML